MELESEMRYYAGWGFAFLSVSVALILHSFYGDVALTGGAFLICVGASLVVISLIPEFEKLPMLSGGVFVGAGALVLMSRYAPGNFTLAIAAIFAVIGVILFLTGLFKEGSDAGGSE
jgi:hypothetical protein